MRNGFCPVEWLTFRVGAPRAVLSGFVALGLGLGCSPNAGPTPPAPMLVEEVPRDLVLTLSEKHQRITGFGASSAWTAPRLSQDLATQFFSAETGLGLSLLRIQIRPDGTTVELPTVDAAVALGARVWASPWSPPAAWKRPGELADPGDTAKTAGGALLLEHYADWAASLAKFAQSMTDRGTPLLGISAQNEPDYDAPWDSCVYTEEELATFVTDNLAPELAKLTPPIPIIAPESANWNTIRKFSDALLKRTKDAKAFLAVATHGYGGASIDYAAPRQRGLEFWLTEISDPDQGADPGMGSALRVASRIQTDLVTASLNAWHYWWLLPRIDSGTPDTNGALTDKQLQLTKRAYALGQFSRFVRPGYVRIGATPRLASEVTASAYQSPDESQLVVVLVNARKEDFTQLVRLPGVALLSAAVWLTDETRSLAAVEDLSRLVASDASETQIELTLPSQSVLTWVGKTQ